MGVNLIDPNEEIRKYVGGGADLSFPGSNNAGSVTTPPEDLVPYANLRVILPGRSVIVDNVADQVQNQAEIGFIVPSKLPPENKGKMGTSWTEIGGLSGFMKEKDGSYTVDGLGNLQREGTWGETFGITDISVKLNASFEPQVFISFVDIRGASLMEPGLNSPYAAFFHMPYPLFTLDLKGYYGKGISYKLHLMKFNSKFDAETGNFIINCEFIGFTFTYLADLAAIYSDVGPDLYGQYVTSDPNYFQQIGNAGSGAGKPWPEGTMTLGPYLNNIADMAAKMEAIENDEVVQDHKDMVDAVTSLKAVIAYWQGTTVNNIRKDGSDDIYTYDPHNETLTVTECLSGSTKTLLPDLECKKKRAANQNGYYHDLLLTIKGYAEKTNNNPDREDALIEKASGAYRPYATSVFASIPKGAKEKFNGDGGAPLPAVSLIKTKFDGPVQWDHDYNPSTPDAYGTEDGGNEGKAVILPDYDDSTANADTGANGCVQVIAKEFLDKAKASLAFAEMRLVELAKEKKIQEETVRLNSLVMPPTLENVFKLILNGVDGFNTTVTNVGKMANKQHQEDGGLRAKLRESDTGTDIKENQKQVFPFPLVYKTVTQGTSSTTNDSDATLRTVKIFPGEKNAGGGEYTYPDYTTDPFKWPEITLVERLIHTLIEKTRQINSTFSEEEGFSDDAGYVAATVEETPPSGNPYGKLTDVEKQIIPLVMLRTMLRLGNSNLLNSSGYGSIGKKLGNFTNMDMSDATGTYSWYNAHNYSETGDNELITELGRMEGETLIQGIEDDATNVRLDDLYTKLTGNAVTQQVPSGTKARSKAWQLYKEAGYNTSGSGISCVSTASDAQKKDTVGCHYMFTNFGNNTPVQQDGPTGTILAGTYSFYGCNYKNQSGEQILNDYGYYLPNVEVELSGDINYDPCVTPETNSGASVCPDFWITGVGSSNNLSPSGEISGGLSEAVQNYYGFNNRAFGGNPEFSDDVVLKLATSSDVANTKAYSEGDDSIAETGHFKTPKYILGKYGTVDYNWDKWGNWDWFSYYNPIIADGKIAQGDTNSEDKSTYMKPDQFSPLAVFYSDGTKYMKANQSISTPYTDSQTFLLEDALWMRNDWENELYNSQWPVIPADPLITSYTTRVELDNTDRDSKLYTSGADTAGYREVLNDKASGVADPRAASNIALAYLYINNCGKYFSLSYMNHARDNKPWDQFNLGKLLHNSGGYLKLPQSVILTLGSLLYRYDETNDIIDWPNYFNRTGKGNTDLNGHNWGVNTVMYQIPRKDERPMPEPWFRLGGGMTHDHRRIAVDPISGSIEPWKTAGDLNNTLHFLAGGCVTSHGDTLTSGSWCGGGALKVFGGAFEFYNSFTRSLCPGCNIHDESGMFTNYGFYEKLPEWLINAPQYIRERLKTEFVSWATGTNQHDKGHFEMHPSFPELKRLMKETTTVLGCDPNESGCTPGLKSDDGNVQMGPTTVGTGINPYTENMDPKSRLYTAFYSWGGDKWNIGDNDSAATDKNDINRGICTMYTEPFGAVHAVYMSTQASNKAKTFVSREMEGQYQKTGTQNNKTLVINFVNMFSNLTSSQKGTTNFRGRTVPNMIEKSEFTYTLPLLWNGWVNERWQGSGEVPDVYGTEGFFTTITKGKIKDYEDLRNFIYSKHNKTRGIYETWGMANTYYYIRKASHTTAVTVPSGYNRLDRTKFDSTSPIVTAFNESIQGFNRVGNEVYKNIHFQGEGCVFNLNFNRGYRFTSDPADGDWAYSYEIYEEAGLGGGIASRETVLGSGFAGSGIQFIPNFYIPKMQYLATAKNNTADRAANELYIQTKDFMERIVEIKNPSWRYWMGWKENDNYVDSVFTTSTHADRFFGGFLAVINEYLATQIKSGAQQTARVDKLDILNDNDIKLDTYLTVKNLHDKWLCEPQQSARNNLTTGNAREAGKIGWLFDQFSFVDRAYNDIRHKFIDPSPLLNLKKNPKMSLYTLIYDLIVHNQFEFFPLPSNIDFSPEEFRQAFTPFLTVNERDMNKNPRFYIMYMGGFSDSLDVDSTDYQYSNDGFDIDDECIDCPADYFGEEVSKKYGDSLVFGQLLSDGKMKCESGECGSGDIKKAPQLVPQTGHWVCWSEDATGGTCKIRTQNVTAFRVAFGQDNQNFFKSVSLDQAEFQETQESLELIDALAKEEGTSKDPMLKGQNLFNVYQKRSYTCSVDAFGMMNILPLQYFQLDQVPMFHGAYIITNVDHTITPGEFQTNFKGTRISRSVVPYVSNFITSTAVLESDNPEISYGQGDVNYTVLDGDVDRVGVWMDSKLTKAALNNTVVSSGINSVGLVLNAHWPNYKKDIGKISPVSGEKVTCATKYMGETWHWQPIHTGTEYSPNSFYGLEELKKECIMLAKKNVFIFIWLYFVPTKSYVEPMCGGTGIESYDPKKDWVDWEAKGASVPPSLPQLVKQLNDACKADPEVGKNCIGAVEFDLEAHYTNTKYTGGDSMMVTGCYTAWSGQREEVYGSYNNVKKKDLALKVMAKLRQDLPSDCQIGISTIMNSSNKSNKNWGKKIRDNDNDYWKGVVCAEYALQSDYVAAQAYSHPRCEEGADEMCKSCTSDSQCSGDNFCQGSTDGVYMGKQPMGKRFYTNKICQEDTYKWDGWAGTGVTGRPGLYARYVKALQDSTWMGHDASSGKPEFVCGLAGYDKKWNNHTPADGATEDWNGCTDEVANGVKAKEVRYFSYLNTFSNGGKGGSRGRMANQSGGDGLWPYGWRDFVKARTTT
jgi:hypothetical protein